ncbi:hypothetical protein D1V04_10340 [Salmonella enterica]|nr:hypothetical protein [Salmonella enterica]EAU6965219.1 hypothetical protein [Salmonella enterica]EBM4473600.1 hypothetical protein [Salmonella enterica]EBM5602284.1 hypothetical protein [Salmonella enterica]
MILPFGYGDIMNIALRQKKNNPDDSYLICASHGKHRFCLAVFASARYLIQIVNRISIMAIRRI